ncbi:FadR/GntR family transcriptional regulator [Piscinibacter sp. XHJ-5]|uniref:FadR/GntR family transcriptional regulator n=1 Tax=Piscinibacter sp. XHJ-5 TaxID=3037797 RepID=UPI0024533584|nr:FadR/GntR family transcriptional regulator [Piscinibacter sp. XHJ-5]
MTWQLPASASAAPRLAADRLSDRLAARLLAQVEAGQLSPGDRLPTEQQLAESHGVSRTVVREAVHQLRSRGLLVSRQGSGVYVAQPAANQPLAFDPRVLDSLAAVVQIVEVRRALEGEIAALAAQRATRSQIAGIRRALRAIETAVAAGGDGVDEDLAFHRAIAEASGNPQFTRLLGFLEQYLREAMRVTRGNEARFRGFADAVREEHGALIDAIAARDAAAARRLATRHMELAARRLEAAGVVRGPERKRGKTR